MLRSTSTKDIVSTFEKIEDSSLVQLVYVSSITLTARLKSSVFNEIEMQARIFNQKHDVTGTLSYGNGKFLQCIEGEKACIMDLQQRIFSDIRHREIRVLLLRAINKRSFVDWRMRMLFLEPWSWSPATKKQAAPLLPFLPLSPYNWTPERTEAFLQAAKNFDTPSHIESAVVNYNAIGNMIRHVVGPHQAFLVVQGVLGLLVVVATTLLFL